MLKQLTFNSREEWLAVRRSYIGGSDAACILGMNPWKDNVTLYEEKRGIREPEDISDSPVVRYGVQAEPLMRELFKLDYPECEIGYEEHNLWWNDDFPFAHASLDGWITDENGRQGILEIKTTTIMNSLQRDHWNGRIPQQYYVQVIHYLMVTGWDFAILSALIRYEMNGSEPYSKIRRYRIERHEVLEDIEALVKAEKDFAERLINGISPGRILPSI